jgi:hypothetical protein
MVYSPFALLAAAIIVSMAFTAADTVETEPLSPSYIQSVEQGWKNTQGRYAVRATGILANLSQSQNVNNYEEAAAGLIEDGRYDGSLRQGSNYISWTQEIDRQSTRIMGTGLEGLNVSTVNLTVETESRFSLELQEINRTFTTVDRTEVYNVEDPLLDSIGIERDINACTFDNLAEKEYSGNSWNGTARGAPVVEPADPSTPDTRNNKILVTSDITQYSGQKNVVDDYAGYSSETQPSDPGSYNDVYVVGAPDTPSFGENQRAIIHEGLWKSNFFRTRDNGCYLPTAHTQTPSIAEKIEGETRGSTPQGAFTVLSIGSDSESEIGYERADASGLNLVQIKGVSTGEGEIWPNFRMSQGLAEELELFELVE